MEKVLPSKKINVLGLKHMKMKGFLQLMVAFWLEIFSFISFMKEMTKFCYLNNCFSEMARKYGNFSL